jgi:hypothetical protein
MAQGYSSHWFNNHGSSGVYRVSISDNELSATSVAMVQGKTYTIRGAMTGLGTDRISYVQEYSEDGKVCHTSIQRVQE